MVLTQGLKNLIIQSLRIFISQFRLKNSRNYIALLKNLINSIIFVTEFIDNNKKHASSSYLQLCSYYLLKSQGIESIAKNSHSVNKKNTHYSRAICLAKY